MFEYSYAEFNAEFERAWKELCLDYNLTPQKHPTAFVIGGQPGAGKSTLRNNIVSNNPNIMVLDADICKTYHPFFDDITTKYPDNAHDLLKTFSGRLKNELTKKALTERYNVVIESTFRDPKIPIDILTDLKAAGYETKIMIQTCNKDVSWNSCLERERLTGRHVEKSFHDDIVDNLGANLSTVCKNDVGDDIQIFAREQDKNGIFRQQEIYNGKTRNFNNEILYRLRAAQGLESDLNKEAFAIKINGYRNLDARLQIPPVTDKYIEADGGRTALQNLVMLDNALSEHYKKPGVVRLPDQYVSFDIKIGEKEYKDLTIQLGTDQNAFGRGFDHLLKLGSTEAKKLAKQDAFDQIVKRDAEGNFVNKFNRGKEYIKYVHDISGKANDLAENAKTLDKIADFTGEEVSASFLRGLAQTFRDASLINSKDREIGATLRNIESFLRQSQDKARFKAPTKDGTANKAIDIRSKEEPPDIPKPSKERLAREYQVMFSQDTGGDNYGVIETLKFSGTKEAAIKFYLEHKDKAGSRLTGGYGNLLESFYYIAQGGDERNITPELSSDIETVMRGEALKVDKQTIKITEVGNIGKTMNAVYDKLTPRNPKGKELSKNTDISL